MARAESFTVKLYLYFVCTFVLSYSSLYFVFIAHLSLHKLHLKLEFHHFLSAFYHLFNKGGLLQLLKLGVVGLIQIAISLHCYAIAEYYNAIS